MKRICAGLATIVGLCACSGSGGRDAAAPTEVAGSAGQAGHDASSGGDASFGGSAASDSGGADSAGDAAAGASGGPSSEGALSLDAPDEEQALLAFLEAKQYSSWAKEADYHASAGPHGGGVRVYYSPKAARALNSDASTFPAGAAAIKELSSGGSVVGWSVWVKVQDATDSGNGFFWYERVHHDGASDTVFGNSRGSRECVGCHQAGKDYDLSTEPFE